MLKGDGAPLQFWIFIIYACPAPWYTDVTQIKGAVELPCASLASQLTKQLMIFVVFFPLLTRYCSTRLYTLTFVFVPLASNRIFRLDSAHCVFAGILPPMCHSIGVYVFRSLSFFLSVISNRLLLIFTSLSQKSQLCSPVGFEGCSSAKLYPQ